MEAPSAGTGEVHSHLSSHSGGGGQPDKGEGMSGKYEAPRPPAGERAREMAGRIGDTVGTIRGRAEAFGSRVGDAAHRSRERVGGYLDDAEEAIDGRTGILSGARNSPLPALGIAFAIGFLLAGSREEEGHPSVSKARNQIKGAVMGGVSAAISQQLRTFIEEQGGIGGLLANLGFGVPGETAEEFDDEVDVRSRI